jgi:hypothetical protein
MPFEALYGIGAAVLFAALIWGTMRYRQRTRAEKVAGDRKAADLFRKEWVWWNPDNRWAAIGPMRP